MDTDSISTSLDRMTIADLSNLIDGIYAVIDWTLDADDGAQIAGLPVQGLRDVLNRLLAESRDAADRKP